MKQFIKKFIPNAVLNKREHLIKQARNFKILAKDYNQYQSICAWNCVDKNGNPIPWYTYPCIEYLENLDTQNKRVLEWGSGNSSLFWAKKSKEVISIEHDKEWFEKIKHQKLPNQKIFLKSIDKRERENASMLVLRVVWENLTSLLSMALCGNLARMRLNMCLISAQRTAQW